MKKVHGEVVNHWETLHRKAVGSFGDFQKLTEEGPEQHSLALKATLLLAGVRTRALQRSLPTRFSDSINLKITVCKYTTLLSSYN